MDSFSLCLLGCGPHTRKPLLAMEIVLSRVGTIERKERESPDKSAEGEQSQEISKSRPALKNFHIFFYLAAPGLSCGIRDLGSWLQLVGSFLLQHVNS